MRGFKLAERETLKQESFYIKHQDLKRYKKYILSIIFSVK